MNKIDIPSTSRIRHRDFIFGVATAAFQIEGDVNNRLPCIWDTFCRIPGKISDHSNGHIACNHIEYWQQDIELISSLGVNAYRFSISWGRVMTASGQINPQGLAFYRQLIDALNRKGIKAFVTLYHWDLPQYLEDKGGWLNRETAYHFRDYADAISRELGDSVYAYTTLNEPFCSAHLGYETGVHAPGKIGQAHGRQAAHHLLLAHGLAMPVLRKNAPNSQHGIVVNIAPCDPLTQFTDDIRAAKLADDYLNHWYISPLLKGTYPDSFSQLPSNARPHIEDGDMAIIQAPLDYFGINYYTRNVVCSNGRRGFEGFEIVPPKKVAMSLTAMGWEVTPISLTKMLLTLAMEYDLPPIYITENGAAYDDQIIDDEINDMQRVEYYKQHLSALDRAINAGVNVQGYFAWSLMDNFEWAEGYQKRFGLCYVDYTTLVRTPKRSALTIKHFLEQKTDAIR
ncbi:GH1 family beta-glucosidase [Shewanella sp. NIFS-20-20]|uniref:GH1 family beta-glucosidase n=1 Tax=Shewanella sp. NIFS-20-20 TaxID=2853806 RepID=UPI001C446AE5|nr:beta-glucosidase [Shewanella sp. NIFS-20-20]